MLDFWLVATMATMATLGSRPLKKVSLGFSLVGYHPTSFPPLKKNSSFNLGVAMVAMVAMPREYTENGSRQMKLSRRGGTRTRNGSSHACVTFGSWPRDGHHGHPRDPTSKKISARMPVGSLVVTSPNLRSLHFFCEVSIRGGHGARWPLRRPFADFLSSSQR